MLNNRWVLADAFALAEVRKELSFSSAFNFEETVNEIWNEMLKENEAVDNYDMNDEKEAD